jgi:hypothetical protein
MQYEFVYVRTMLKLSLLSHELISHVTVLNFIDVYLNYRNTIMIANNFNQKYPP